MEGYQHEKMSDSGQPESIQASAKSRDDVIINEHSEEEQLAQVEIDMSSQAYQKGRQTGNEETMTDLLITACKEGVPDTVNFILKKLDRGKDLSAVKSSENNLGPLHYASIKGHEEIVDILLNKKFPISMEDSYGNTALHLAASNGHLGTVKKILDYESKCNQEVSESQQTNLIQHLTKEDLTPLGCALKAKTPHYEVAKQFLNLSTGNPSDVFPDFGKAFLNGYRTWPLDKPAKIFVIGDSGVGKSTLTKALQESRSVLSIITFGLAAARRRIRSLEDQHFTGIISTDFYSPNSNRVIFYDLAGHTNYFNKDLVDSSEDISLSVFVILVNLQDSVTKMTERLSFWLSFLYHHLHLSSSNAEEIKPNVIVVGSRRDTLRAFSKKNERLLQAFTETQVQNQQLADSFSFIMKPLSLDCRKFQTADMRNLRATLYRHCLKLVPNNPLPTSMCYILSSLFHSTDYAAKPALTLKELTRDIVANYSKQELSLFHLLPVEVSQLFEICKELSSCLRILLFPDPKNKQSVEDTWIVHNSHMILTEIDSKLSSIKSLGTGINDENLHLQDFQTKLHFSFGIVTRQVLDKALSPGMSSDFILDTDLAIKILQHFKYTELVESGVFEYPAEQAFFLPGLLQVVGDPDNWEGKNFRCALSILASKTQNQGNAIMYFLPRFLKKLLLCLVQKFILPNISQLQPRGSSDEVDSQSSMNDNSTAWSRGVSWLTGDGIHVMVVTNDNAIILSMYAEPGCEISCISLRNEIICTIDKERIKWQDSIKTEVLFLPIKEEMLPVKFFEAYPDQWIALKDVYQSLTEGKIRYHDTSFSSLFYFEPGISMLDMSQQTLQFLSDPENSKLIIDEEILHDIYASFGSSKEAVIKHFNLPLMANKEEAITSDSGSREVVIDIIEDEHDSQSTVLLSRSSPSAVSSNAGLRPNAKEDNSLTLTCEEFLDFMASVSILDNIVGFLNEIKDKSLRQSTSSSTEEFLHYDAEAERDTTGTLRYTIQYPSVNPFRPIETSPLPFIGAASSVECTSEENTFYSKEHNISILIPKGALSKPTTIEVGVMMTGPFCFPENTELVSVILWLCSSTKKPMKFSKPMEITLPHFIDCSDREDYMDLAFMKANHNSNLSDKPFVFAEVPDQVSFNNKSGTLKTKHACFLCIVHKVPSKVFEKANFCLIQTIPRCIIESKFEMNFCVSYALKTCIECVCKQFPDCEIKKQTFKFDCSSGDPDPAIEIDHNQLQFGWKAGKTNLCCEIHASEVKFSMNDSNWIADDEYPPRFTIEVVGTMATDCELLCVSFTGATRKLALQKPLALQTIQRTRNLSSKSSAQSIFIPLGILERNIRGIINFLDIDQIRPVLTEQGTLLPEEQETLIQMGSSLRGNQRGLCIEKLMGMLRQKGCRGIRDFIFALQKTSDQCLGHKDILRLFEDDSDYDYVMNSDLA